MYSAILRTPGVAQVIFSSIVGRLPTGALGLLLLLRTREMTGSYAAGGLVAAVNSLAYGVGSPALGRLIDRRGQTGVLIVSGSISAAALAVFALLPDGTALGVACAVAAVIGGLSPPFPAMQRAIWNDVIEPALRHSMYALEAVLFELVYIAGPLVVIGLIGTWSLQAAAWACAIATIVGTLAFAASRLSRAWRPEEHRPADLWGALRGPGVRTILLSLTVFGAAVACIEIAVAAFANGEHRPGAIGVLLALWGVGSMVGGLIFGRFGAPADPPRLVALLMGLLAVANIPLALAGDVISLGAALLLAGGFIAPVLASTFSLLSDVAPAGTVTEAQTWVGTSFGTGIAAGSALAGWLVDGPGTATTFVVAVGLLLVSAGILAVRRNTLRVPDAPLRPQPPRPARPQAGAPEPARQGSR